MKSSLLKGLILVATLSTVGCVDKIGSPDNRIDAKLELNLNPFYAAEAEQVQVQFTGLYKSEETNLDAIVQQKASIEKYEIAKTVQYMFGPMTHREWGGPQKGEKIRILTEDIQIFEDHSLIPYTYTATWILRSDFAEAGFVELPIPFNTDVVFSKYWKKCTDSSPSHQERSVFWYYWEPNRYGCDHKINEHYQNVKVTVLEKTESTSNTRPEYERLVRFDGETKKMAMTFAFGYVEDEAKADPFKSYDSGMREFRKFVKTTRELLVPHDAVESSLMLSAYTDELATVEDRAIGTRFSFTKDEIEYQINIVTSSDVDQMDLFAKSFSRDHESFFAWFGHSRVGSGFDALMFGQKLNLYPERYSLTDDYQIIYWAGCNSYSYYTQPFFDLKGGTKNLDIVSNGLPSYFHYNADSGIIFLKALISPELNLTYQTLVSEIEMRANFGGSKSLVNVLGDEDNLD